MESGYQRAKEFSDHTLAALRDDLETSLAKPPLVITCGSYARREACPLSDMDYYVVRENGETPDGESEKIREAIQRHVKKAPADGGAFATDITLSELLSNFGGSKDSNDTITRRMLYLLEGDHLTNKEEFLKYRREIIEKYVGETPRDHQLAFYLLNDLIRYWRTLTVDYANKTYEASRPKPWAIRNIKLVFSRKLIFASGLFSVALTADRTKNKKIDILESLFSMPPIERIEYVCGKSASQRLFQIYDFFLEEMEKSETRKSLESLERNSRETDEIFRTLKNEGHYFSRELYGLFEKTFHSSHPIRMAAVF